VVSANGIPGGMLIHGGVYTLFWKYLSPNKLIFCSVLREFDYILALQIKNVVLQHYYLNKKGPFGVESR
jgi:hypothetical protein